MSQGEARGVDCIPKGVDEPAGLSCMRGPGVRLAPANAIAAPAGATDGLSTSTTDNFWLVVLTREYTMAAPAAKPPAKPPRKARGLAGSSACSTMALGTIANGTSAICCICGSSHNPGIDCIISTCGASGDAFGIWGTFGTATCGT